MIVTITGVSGCELEIEIIINDQQFLQVVMIQCSDADNCLEEAVVMLNRICLPKLFRDSASIHISQSEFIILELCVTATKDE